MSTKVLTIINFCCFCFNLDDDFDVDDLYSNAHKIALHHRNDSDEEAAGLNEYFDEYFHYLF